MSGLPTQKEAGSGFRVKRNEAGNAFNENSADAQRRVTLSLLLLLVSLRRSYVFSFLQP